MWKQLEAYQGKHLVAELQIIRWNVMDSRPDKKLVDIVQKSIRRIEEELQRRPYLEATGQPKRFVLTDWKQSHIATYTVYNWETVSQLPSLLKSIGGHLEELNRQLKRKPLPKKQWIKEEYERNCNEQQQRNASIVRKKKEPSRKAQI